MRRIALALTVMAVAMILGSGVALAATITCDGGECEHVYTMTPQGTLVKIK